VSGLLFRIGIKAEQSKTTQPIPRVGKHQPTEKQHGNTKQASPITAAARPQVKGCRGKENPTSQASLFNHLPSGAALTNDGATPETDEATCEESMMRL
jgi:hypothetical protein